MNKSSFFLPEQGSTIAPDVDSLFYFIFTAAAIIFLIVVITMALLVWRYRRRSQEAGLTPGKDHNLKLELLWTIIPTILVLITFVWGFKTYLKMNVVPRDAIEIKVTGKKWMWIFDYPNGTNSLNELIVPAHRPIKLLLSSEDVIHSFYVPGFRIKMDVLPNRYNVTWFEAAGEGEYDLFCAEYCGTGHSRMLGKVRVLEENEWNKWLEEGALKVNENMPLPELGKLLTEKKACNTCHTHDGSPLVGPTFWNLFGHTVELSDGSTVVVDENYIRQSILDPMSQVVAGYNPVMPTFKGLLRERELDALIAYIKTLKAEDK
ncbi:MAG: cytochrome c oxidase subunit II [Candidatus Neomarinimicrobiota bacterium]|nr:MAG: cytochrome c oxidase subunit II [Candidatus Neomarinimicrobiota bacterium]